MKHLFDGFTMKQAKDEQQEQKDRSAPDMDEVLRRMLSTPPDPRKRPPPEKEEPDKAKPA